MVKAFNKARKNNRLYVRLLSADAGAVVDGEIARVRCPPSVLAVLDADRSGGGVSSARAAPRSASGTSPPSTPSAAPGP